MTSDEILKEEIESILADVLELYEKEDKKVSGEFENGLGAVYEPNKATIRGYVYLAGRRAGKMPPVANIEKWVREKGIYSVQKDSEYNSIAWAVAKKIAKSGTAKEYELKVYEKVITPERISKIINRVSKINVNRIISELRLSFDRLAKNV